MTSSNGNIFRVTGHLCGEFIGPGEFPAQRPVTRSFDVFFDLHPNKGLSNWQWWAWWFETPPCPLRRHRNGVKTEQNKQRVLMHGHQGWNVRHGLCHIYMRYVYIYIWVVYSLCFFCCLFITVTWWYVWCIGWASGNQEEVQACLVTLWLFIISCYSLYKTTLGFLCSWFENNPHFHKYSMDFHV